MCLACHQEALDSVLHELDGLGLLATKKKWVEPRKQAKGMTNRGGFA
jgi:hypothetical protein